MPVMIVTSLDEISTYKERSKGLSQNTLMESLEQPLPRRNATCAIRMGKGFLVATLQSTKKQVKLTLIMYFIYGNMAKTFF